MKLKILALAYVLLSTTSSWACSALSSNQPLLGYKVVKAQRATPVADADKKGAKQEGNVKSNN